MTLCRTYVHCAACLGLNILAAPRINPPRTRPPLADLKLEDFLTSIRLSLAQFNARRNGGTSGYSATTSAYEPITTSSLKRKFDDITDVDTGMMSVAMQLIAAAVPELIL
eukprot:11019-Heterococcus_DN1.PRE.1